jgi:autotransporter-associated beta strand protein
MNRPYRPRLAALLLAQIALAASANASTTWDGSATPDTNISTPANWSDDILPDLTGPSVLTFPTASGTATFDVPVEIARAVLSNSFTLAPGAGSLTIRATSSGGNSYGIQATSGAALAVIDVPVLVKATAPASGQLGNLFLVFNNRLTADTTTLKINGGIALAPGSTATSYVLRYGNNTSLSANTSDTRIAGPITGMSNLQNSSTGGTAWAGDLIIAGDQAGLTTTDFIMGVSGFIAPTATARLVLGETKDDDQTWRNVSLLHVMNLAIGGNITISALTTSSTNATKITGIAADLPSAGTLRIASGTVNTVCAIGGTGTNENHLHLAKYGTGTLTINGTHTYLGTTTVEAGALNLNGTVASPVVVSNSSVLTLGASAAANGGITIGSGSSLSGEGVIGGSLTFDPGFSYLNFDPATTAALSTASLSATGATIVVTPASTGTVDTPYLVLTSTAGLAGTSFTVGSPGTLSVQNGGTELWFTPTAAAAQTITWTGTDATNPSVWNVAAVSNWLKESTPATFFGGDNVIFDDSATTTSITVQGSVSVGSATFNNSEKAFSLSGGAISGAGAVIQTGPGNTTITNILSNSGGVTVNAGNLELAGANTFTGGLDVLGGTLSFSTIANLGSTATAIDLSGGGTLRFKGTATITNDVLPFTVGTGGAILNTDTNNNITIRLGGKISGDGAITKSGPGILSLGRSSDVDPGNDFTGTFTVSAGILDLRALNSLGATSAGTTVQDATLLIQNFGQAVGTKTFPAEPLTFSGNAFVTAYNQENKLFTNQLSGPVTVAEGAVLGLSTARNSTGAISPTLELTGTGVTTTAGSTLSFGLRTPTYPAGLFEDYQTVTITGPVTGPAAVITQGTALSLYTLNAPDYSGDTSVLGGILKLGAANPSNDASTVTIATTDAKIELAFTGTDTVSRLFIGTTQQPAGTYGATGSGATNIDDVHFLGSGTLTVTSSPVVVSAYDSWAATFDLTGDDALAGSDPDHDGLDNILEYATGTSPIASGGTSGFSVSPAGEFLALTYTRIADPSLTYTVEGSSDLTGAWSPVVVAGNPSTGADNVAGSVTITDTVSISSGKRFLRLKVTY